MSVDNTKYGGFISYGYF